MTRYIKKPLRPLTDAQQAEVDRAVALLAGLGSTAAEVAESLRAKGVTGCPGHGGDCPIYNYLVKEHVRVFKVTTEEAVSFIEGWRAPLPDPVKDFVNVFDGGAFPFLAG